MEKEDIRSLTLRLPGSVHKKLRLLSVHEDQTMTEIIIDCIKERYSRHQNEPAKE